MLGVLLLGAAAPASAQEDSALASMIAAELAFAAQAEREGVRAAFMAYLSEGAVLFAPDPVDGLAFYTDRPASSDRLVWYPSYAGIATTGDLGYTAGPFEFRPDGADSTVYHGHFASVWRREADGVWKVALDMGTGHDRPRAKAPVARPVVSVKSRHRYVAVAPLTTAGVNRVAASLLALDSSFARTAAALGTAEALDQFAADEIRVHRPDVFPVTGRRTAVRLIRREPGTPHWRPLGGGAATSGELGFTWGAVRWDTANGAADAGHYLRVWRRQPDGWRVVLDVVARRDG